jgi:transcriptional regulator with XRE-family HTH domain
MTACVKSNTFLPPQRAMNLAEFVDLTMKAKNLTALDIERNSGKMITDGHVATVLAGKAENPTLRILLGLAKGLDVDPTEVFRAAAEVSEPQDRWTAHSLIQAIQKLPGLKPAEIKQIKKILKID